MNKNLKVLIFSVISVLFLSTIIPFNGVQANAINNSILLQSDNLLVQIVEENDDYQKTKFTYLDTGEVEYLEYNNSNSNSEPIYRLKESDGETHLIQKENDKIYMDNKLVLDFEEKDYSNNLSKNSKNTWRKISTFRYSSSVDVGSATLVIGILASLFGGPITGVMASMASFIISNAIKTVYYSVTQYVSTKTYGLARNDYIVYRYSNYTGKIGSGSREFYYIRPY